MKRVVFPGRFQPFHKGHLYVVKKLLEEYDEVVIVIGSAQEGFTCANPFTASERFEMIHKALEYEGIKRERYWIVPVPDLNKPLAWTSYVISMVPHVEAVASGNPHVLYLFEWFGLKTIEVDLIFPEKYCGTRIRELMCRGDEWRKYVPEPVSKYIDEIGGVERVRRLCHDKRY
ncbi:MAG: nicotinamide-nucleotide adenylyltransferase [Staphylothermus sp.]|nr:nicotinamide-nucleotide adenylyltransferase [Staphylothermus sp.]